MMPSRLYLVDGNNHFMTKRFDRKDGKKVHTQTLAAASPGADSHEQLIAVCRKLHLPETDCYGYSTGWSLGATTLTKENKIQT